MKILYFAWMRQRIGASNEDMDLPDSVNTVDGLVDWLIARGDGYAQAFAKREVIRAAVNQEYVQFDHAVTNGDEIAFFPPVTGG
ncbi:MAG: molybdopterin converting factor subunit 1 [Alphaproteobacteria bacterium]|jgi:sulfur-carrier protein|nr:molybdopterin converting factor subunit 1 [Alphaproteobacteria bacterium]